MNTNYMSAIRLGIEPQRSLLFSAIPIGAYVPLGTRLEHPARIVFITNLIDAPIQFSLDGINDHFIINEDWCKPLNICANQSVSQGFYVAKNTQFYVQRLASDPGGSGSIYLSIFYGDIS